MSGRGEFTGHRPGHLKQQNKSHKSGGASNRSRHQQAGGRVDHVRPTGKKRLELSKQQRRNQAKQQRKHSRQKTMRVKRGVGSSSSGSAAAPPLLVAVVALSPAASSAAEMLHRQAAADDRDGDVSMAAAAAAAAAAVGAGLDEAAVPPLFTALSSKHGRRFTFAALNPLEATVALDVCQAADVVCLVQAAQDPEPVPESAAFLHMLRAQGVPAVMHALVGLETLPAKRRSAARSRATKLATDAFPDTKLVLLSPGREADLCLWQLANLKLRPVRWRDMRPHLVAEAVSFQPSAADPASGHLLVRGYVRGQAWDPNRLVYLPGWGAFQLDAVQLPPDPLAATAAHASARKGAATADAAMEAAGAEPSAALLPSPELQESLVDQVPLDPNAGEQTWPTEEELAAAEAGGGSHNPADVAPPPTHGGRFVRVPRGTSSYQAAWIVEAFPELEEEGGQGSDNEDEDEDDQDDDEDADMHAEAMDASQLDSDGEGSDHGDAVPRGVTWDLDDDEASEMVSIAGGEAARMKRYDDEMDMEDEEATLQKIKAAREDAEFPDEVDTPLHVPARQRFAKYRGLQSFRQTPWNPKEDLPDDYGRIFQFENFQRTRKRVLRDARMEGVDGRADVGTFVQLVIRNVPAAFAATWNPSQHLVVFALLEHENKMSVLHFRITLSSDVAVPIKSKDRLVFRAGVRRFATNPVFSQHTNGGKHKFMRYLQPGETCVASVLAPIQYPPGPVLVYKLLPSGREELIATGALLSNDPDRLVIKRIRLSGYPLKINKRSATIRYMFFNPEDVRYFKPVELSTKYGRRGHIKESLGTKGHFKAVFDGQLKAADTIILALYKRVFPKWTYAEAARELHAAPEDGHTAAAASQSAAAMME